MKIVEIKTLRFVGKEEEVQRKLQEWLENNPTCVTIEYKKAEVILSDDITIDVKFYEDANTAFIDEGPTSGIPFTKVFSDINISRLSGTINEWLCSNGYDEVLHMNTFYADGRHKAIIMVRRKS